MTDSTRLSQIELRLDNLIADMRLLLATQQEHKSQLANITARIKHIDQARAIPAYYTHREATDHLGVSQSAAYKDPRLLPRPIDGKRPFRYRVEAVEAMAEEKEAVNEAV